MAFRFRPLAAATLLIVAALAGGAAPYPRVDRGPAPELAGITAWLNGPPLSLAALRGRVVLVDFWTYGCVDCVRSLPSVVRWHQRYRDQGLVVVGVHTPEFAVERSTDRLRRAIERLGIEYPVAQDNAYATWTAFGAEAWPTQVLIDRRGRITLVHVGDGDDAAIEATIRAALAE